jgi:hypothetical protein
MGAIVPETGADPSSDLPPLDVTVWESVEASRWARTLSAATWTFVAIGVLLRVIRYVMDFPLWGDEAFLAINFLDRGYRELLRPLDYGQVCPLLFLWIELTAVKLFGFNEASLRIFPLVCGVASLFLFRQVAGRLVRGLPLLLAVGFMAVSVHPIRHATDAKPYASDLLAALALMAPAFAWWQAPRKTRPLWALAAVAPIAVMLSHPAVFVVGGLALGLARPVWKWRIGRWRVRLPFVVFLLGSATTFFLQYTLLTGGQSRDTLESYRRGVWAPAFPPLDHPLRVPGWFLNVNTGPMFAYPLGGLNGKSSATTLCFVVAAVFLWRRGRRAVLLALLGPFLLTLGAATLGRYPYGHAARQMQFVAPAICLLGGLGAALLLRATPWSRLRPWLVGAVMFLLAFLALEHLNQDAVRQPYCFRSDLQAREFARRFWPSLARDAEVACGRLDFGIINHASLNLWTALHVCNQRIYLPGRGRSDGPRWDSITPDHPLCCVLYHEMPPEIPEVTAWMARMLSRFEVRRSEWVELDLSGASSGPRRERWLVIEFVPKADRRLAEIASPPGAASSRSH